VRRHAIEGVARERRAWIADQEAAGEPSRIATPSILTCPASGGTRRRVAKFLQLVLLDG